MAAFAANSVLNRMAVGGGEMSPGLFAVIRTFSGAMILLTLVAIRSRPVKVGRGWGGAVALALYMGGFSLAYLGLDTGVGALILFGGVQITMFAGAVVGGDQVPARRWIGAAISLGGLAVLLWPDEATGALPWFSAVLMGVAAVGWGVYSLIGRRAVDPLAATARNFARAVPLTLPLLVIGWSEGWVVTGSGLAYAVIAGAVTSGLGYALWYHLLPTLGATRAAVAQLSVPVLAALGGTLILAEPLELRFVVATGLVLGGIALSLVQRKGAQPQ
jgi:drug/metabolite transporter (DMT)-like permease